MLAGADVDVVDVGPRRRSISSLTVDAMRAESSWVSVTGDCSAEGGVDGETSLALDLDPRVGLSVLFPRRVVREARRPRVEDMAVFTEQRWSKENSPVANVGKVKLLQSSTNPNWLC